ncbi:putative bifunctional diguanylate cyclase/phosphodiesterase [Pseudaestuariivita sp.]|uniref:putative bifunctional diguanylate cyclase/phosphodiesterase n=1 Tax=Pseudaestuariivita sp. TaxID=2211669 RepID=UPI00405956BB
MDRVRAGLAGPQLMAFYPAGVLAAFWMGGEVALIAFALAGPVVVALVDPWRAPTGDTGGMRDSITGLVHRGQFLAALDIFLKGLPASGRKTACFTLELDEFGALADKHGPELSEALLSRAARRLQGVTRDRELVCRSGDHRFSVALDPVRDLDLETCIRLSSRMQSAVAEPITLSGNTYYISCSVGFSMSRASTEQDAKSLHAASLVALSEAQRHGPSTIRAYSDEVQTVHKERAMLSADIAQALEADQFQAWFQPQVSTETGEVLGFEALARWRHPNRGMVPPGEFLPLMERNGQLDRLGQSILNQSLAAISAWDRAGIFVPRVGVNFTADELRNPRLVDRIEWALDRYDIAADRLCVEILENVVSRAPDDITACNIRRLAQLGCAIDLDDFGTGSTSISSLRRFPVTRLKIDRSFVTNADQSDDQQRMIAAILTMSERLGLETLAEGIETPGEHAMVAQLGCSAVQGFGISRPMPFEKTIAWLTQHTAEQQKIPTIGRKTG